LTDGVFSVDVSNVLNEQKKQEVLALGRLGWSLRRIERETGIRRETIAGYLKTAAIVVRPSGRWGKLSVQPDSKPANGVTTDFGGPKGDIDPVPDLHREISKPANEVIPDSAPGASQPPKQTATASASEPYRELIEQALSRDRNAKAIWQDLVDDHGFAGSYQSVKRFINKLRGSPEKQPCAVIVTAPGEDYGKSRVMLRAGAATGFWRRRGRPGAGP
jgi:hypothetical protein